MQTDTYVLSAEQKKRFNKFIINSVIGEIVKPTITSMADRMTKRQKNSKEQS